MGFAGNKATTLSELRLLIRESFQVVIVLR
jgi:hypothetical protein